MGAKLARANLRFAFLYDVDLRNADMWNADLIGANLSHADLSNSDLRKAYLVQTNFTQAKLTGTKVLQAVFSYTVFGFNDLRDIMNLEEADHYGPSVLGLETVYASEGKLPETFLRGCGLSDSEIEAVKLYNPDLSNDEVNKILYKMYDVRATQALQISPLFISYTHADGKFVDKIGNHLKEKGLRYWRYIHEMKAGRLEKQIDIAIRQNPTILLVLSENSLTSDWVEHEVRTARELEKEMRRDVLCPVALDDSWKDTGWPKRIMEQVMEYNILDFSAWKDDSKFDGMFRKLIEGLELFYKR